MNQNPKLSIITVVYNGEATISDCIESVLSQDYNNIEHIIVDGLSTDRTMEIIGSYSQQLAKVVSEKDGGIFDAMNKGIGMATGDIVAILNSDDFYLDNKVISNVVKRFQEVPDASCLHGDLLYVDANDADKVSRTWKSGESEKWKFLLGWHPAHPSFFVKREVYENHGDFLTDMKVSADYEIMLRFLYFKNIKSVYIPKILVKMRTGGNSGESIENIVMGNLESVDSWRRNGWFIPVWIFFTKPLSKLFQFFS